jgi:hypothetical protein
MDGFQHAARLDEDAVALEMQDDAHYQSHCEGGDKRDAYVCFCFHCRWYWFL